MPRAATWSIRIAGIEPRMKLKRKTRFLRIMREEEGPVRSRPQGGERVLQLLRQGDSR
jgi:hypothetical protein